VVERQFGEGRVVAFLTTAAPLWNNWARNPSFAVVMQELQAYLAGRPTLDDTHLVGSGLKLDLDPEQYLPKIQFITPAGESTAAAASAPNASGVYEARLTTEGRLRLDMAETPLSGVYQAQLARVDGEAEQRSFAVNVDPEEGALAALDGPQLAERLAGVDYSYEQAASFQYDVGESQHGNLWRWVLYAVVILLICEQLLAWSASYHPSTAGAPAAAPGGVR
jgi:hypothetical protein